MAVFGVLGTDWKRLTLKVECTGGHEVDLTDVIGRREDRVVSAGRLSLIVAEHSARSGMVKSEGGRESEYEWVLIVLDGEGRECPVK